jgi:hypothetical protein
MGFEEARVHAVDAEDDHTLAVRTRGGAAAGGQKKGRERQCGPPFRQARTQPDVTPDRRKHSPNV